MKTHHAPLNADACHGPCPYEPDDGFFVRCPLCDNGYPHPEGTFVLHDDVHIAIRGECGHRWTIVLENVKGHKRFITRRTTA